MLASDFPEIGREGCLFLVLCSIADEWNESQHNQRHVDILQLYIQCRDKGYLAEGFFCNNPCKILELATGMEWKKQIVEKLPPVIDWKTYSVEKWVRIVSHGVCKTHFRRRWGDTITNSVTVQKGKIESYYLFSVVGV